MILGKYSIIQIGGFYGLKNGSKLVIDPVFKELLWFEYNKFIVQNEDEKWLIVNDLGNNILDEEFDRLHQFKNGVATFQKSNEFIFVNGYDVFKRVKFNNPDAYFNSSGLSIIQTEDGREGVILENGEWFLTPAFPQTLTSA